MVKRIHNISFHALLMLVYAVFFSVQFFFNLDFPGSGNIQPFLEHVRSEDRPAKMVSSVKETPSHPSVRPIRLNKRFQQENFLACEIFSMDSPEPYAIRATVLHYPGGFLSTAIPAHRLLRGPPAMA